MLFTLLVVPIPQAAGTARNDKAMLAESKAQLSRAKDMAAQKTAQQALKDAQVAKEKAELYKNAPRVAGIVYRTYSSLIPRLHSPVYCCEF